MTAASQLLGECEITWDGYLHLSGDLADRLFPAGVCVAHRREEVLTLVPLHGQANGGLVIKRRNRAGDRSLLLNEVLGFSPRPGRFELTWDAARASAVITLDHPCGAGA